MKVIERLKRNLMASELQCENFDLCHGKFLTDDSNGIHPGLETSQYPSNSNEMTERVVKRFLVLQRRHINDVESSLFCNLNICAISEGCINGTLLRVSDAAAS